MDDTQMLLFLQTCIQKYKTQFYLAGQELFEEWGVSLRVQESCVVTYSIFPRTTFEELLQKQVEAPGLEELCAWFHTHSHEQTRFPIWCTWKSGCSWKGMVLETNAMF